MLNFKAPWPNPDKKYLRQDIRRPGLDANQAAHSMTAVRQQEYCTL